MKTSTDSMELVSARNGCTCSKFSKGLHFIFLKISSQRLSCSIKWALAASKSKVSVAGNVRSASPLPAADVKGVGFAAAERRCLLEADVVVAGETVLTFALRFLVMGFSVAPDVLLI